MNLLKGEWDLSKPVWSKVWDGGWLFVCPKAPSITHGWWGSVGGQERNGPEYGTAGLDAADRWADSLSPETAAAKALAAQWEALLGDGEVNP